MIPRSSRIARPCGRLALSVAGLVVSLSAQAPVEVARVGPRALVRTVRLPGTLEPFEQVDLPARVDGYVARLLVDLGDRVDEGALLAEIDVPERIGEIARAEADVARCRAEAGYRATLLAQAQAARKADPGAVSARDLARLEGEHAVASAAVDVAVAELTRLRSLEALQQVRAPFAGRVVARHVAPGALVGSAAGAAVLFTIAQTDRLRCRVDVPELDAASLEVGRPVRVLVRAVRRRIDATVSRMAGRIDAASRTLRIEIDVANAEEAGAVKAGAFADVEVTVDVRDAGLAVPPSAVVGTTDAPAVFVAVGEGGAGLRWERRPVRIGLRGDSGYEILEGLAAGERVAIAPRGLVVGPANVGVREVESW